VRSLRGSGSRARSGNYCHIKTSMNELARLGLLSILRDYKQHKKESLVYKVKKS
jgi:hypothetical protein